MKRRSLLLAAGAACATAGAAEPPLPIFNSHLHCSHDAWERLPPKEAVAILRRAGLKGAMVSSSSDERTQRLFEAAPDLVIPVLRPYRTRADADLPVTRRVVELRRHPRWWCDLAFRSEHAANGKVDPGRRAAFMAFPDRFLVGTDTFTPKRWFFVVEHANSTRQWLADLPRDVAERIAWKNGDTVFAPLLKKA